MGRISPCAAQHEAILTLRNQGLMMRQIAARLGLPERSAGLYLRRRSIHSLHHKGRDRLLDPADVRRLLGDGLTQDAIAERLGAHETTVDRAIPRLRKTEIVHTARRGPRAMGGHPEWKGGRTLDKHGYVLVYAPLHPQCRKSGRIFEHRLVMEVTLGRYSRKEEVPDQIGRA